jgi:hypothetical protein
MKIANIVIEKPLNLPRAFNVVQNYSEVINGLPTLIVGFDYVNKNYSNFDIMDRKLSENLYWTVKKTEKRDKYEDDLNWFVSKVYQDILDKVHYVFVDPLQYDCAKLFKVVKKIYSLNHKTSFFNGDMVYIYGESLIFGVDLKLLKFIGLDTNKIANKIKNISDYYMDIRDITPDLKKHLSLSGNKMMYVPYFRSIFKEQIFLETF